MHNELLNSNLVDFGLKLILGIVSGGNVRNHGSVNEIYPKGREPMLIFGFEWFSNFEQISDDQVLKRWMIALKLDFSLYKTWYIAVVADVHFLWADVLLETSEVRFRDSLKKKINYVRYQQIFQLVKQMLSIAAELSGETVDLGKWTKYVCTKTIQQNDLTSCGPLFLRNGFDEISSEKGGMGSLGSLDEPIFRTQFAKFLHNEILKQETLSVAQDVPLLGAQNAETEGNECVFALKFELTNKRNRETDRLHLFNQAPYGTVFGKAVIRRAQGGNQPFSSPVFLRGNLHSVQPLGSCAFICIFEGINAANQDPVLSQKLRDIFGTSCNGWNDLCLCVHEIKTLQENEIKSGRLSASHDVLICKRMRLLFSQQMSHHPELFTASFSNPCPKTLTRRGLGLALSNAGITVKENACEEYANVLKWAVAILSPDIVFNEGLNDVFRTLVNNKLAICTIQSEGNDAFSFVSDELPETVEAILVMTISKLSAQNSHCEIFKSNNQSIFVFKDLKSVLVENHPKQLSDMIFLDSQSDVAVKGNCKRMITDFFTSQGDVSKRLAPNDAKEAPSDVADVDCSEREKKIYEAAELMPKNFLLRINRVSSKDQLIVLSSDIAKIRSVIESLLELSAHDTLETLLMTVEAILRKQLRFKMPIFLPQSIVRSLVFISTVITRRLHALVYNISKARKFFMSWMIMLNKAQML